MKRNQSGATLIVVLLFLILIMLVGAIAVRQSSTDLKVATSDQVDTLLLNSSDGVNADLEQTVNTTGSKEYTSIISPRGVFGHFMGITGDSNRGDQVIFCYNPRRSDVFSLFGASVLTLDGGKRIVGGATDQDGYCDPSKGSNYTSARNTVMTQVMITRPDAEAAATKAFDGVSLSKGISADDPSSSEILFDIYSSSVLPALSSASDSTVKDCFKKPSQQASRYKSGKKDSDGKPLAYDQTLSGCMQTNGIPTTTLVEQARMQNITTSEICINFGKGSGSISTECQKKYNLTADGNPKPPGS